MRVLAGAELGLDVFDSTGMCGDHTLRSWDAG